MMTVAEHSENLFKEKLDVSSPQRKRLQYSLMLEKQTQTIKKNKKTAWAYET